MLLTRVGPVFGAEVAEVNLACGLGDDQINDLMAALAVHEVLVFRNQQMTAQEQVAFGRRLGELVVSPFSPNADDAATTGLTKAMSARTDGG